MSIRMTRRGALLSSGAALAAASLAPLSVWAAEAVGPKLLTDPFLQLPSKSSVRVVWMTEFEGQGHAAVLADGRRFAARTVKLSRMAEDETSHVGSQQGDGTLYKGYTPRDIWRHEAEVTGLTAGQRRDYHVVSTDDDGAVVESETFSLAPDPAAGQPLRILLTSDHQLKPMTPANMQFVEQMFGRLDAVFYAGDLQNVPDQASGWFDDNRGLAFFPGLQGHADNVLERERVDGATTTTTRTRYRGGRIIQNAPFFSIIGNHEVMGRFNSSQRMSAQHGDPVPRRVAEALYEEVAALHNPAGDPQIRADWIRDNSFNTVSYEEIVTLPDEAPGGKTYWAKRFGDIFLIGLYGTRIWRSASAAAGTRGKYREAEQYLDKPDEWGWGEFIFEDMNKGSAQYDWLKGVLESEDFRSAPVKIVMMHNPSHGLGDNSVPVYAQPVQILDRDEDGQLIGVRYEYPLENDQYIRDVEPMLEKAGVQLLQNGHSHLWNRFVTKGGMNVMETSNVGNSYGCYVAGVKDRRDNGPHDARFDMVAYPLQGDPFGLEPVVPTVFAPERLDDGSPKPGIGSNTLSAFSILETDGRGGASVISYVFDTTRPGQMPKIFDRFDLA